MHCKELALEAGRNRQSQETGFIHYCYQADSRDTVPVRENLCFVLALLQSRAADNIQEAKRILERLLCYQESGNFPVYLHEFPDCYNRWKSIEVLPSLIWILKGYHHVIGPLLKQKVEKCIRLAFDHALIMLKEYSANDSITLRLGCALFAFGEYSNEKALADQGKKWILSVKESGPNPSWFVSEQLGSFFVSLSLVRGQIWPELLDHCFTMYHPGFCTYCGPCLAEKQLGNNPEPTLLDFYLNRNLPKRLQKMHPIHLQCSLVRPQEEEELLIANTGNAQGVFSGWKWRVSKEREFALGLVEGDLTQDNIKGFSPLRLVWGDRELPESLVLQMANVNSYTCRLRDHEVEIRMRLGEIVENDHPKDRVEAAVFCSRSGGKVNVDGQKATLFYLGDTVQIESGIRIFIQFHLIEGEGDFTGHLAIGNRPSQILTDHDPYDWKISLRSVRRFASCVICMKLKVGVH